jgi:hypothetical protein
MDNGFIDILKQLAKEQGHVALTDARVRELGFRK